MTSREIRRQFLDFFKDKEHTIVPSSPVVPFDDPTLMFANAGMNQFKDVFLGTGSRPYSRAADTQKCIRAGGKHNDLDDVGQDTYHHTFFEMLGNWSFGDYFKEEAIRWAWELLTEVWSIDKSRLHVTYFEGDRAEGLHPDTEAANLWRHATDISPNHIHPGSKKDNFWEMGETGPCGPCSEIHIDLTADKAGSELVNAGDHRVMEIWNLVFIQYNRGNDGKLVPLPAKHVDTGMGFERICAVLQGKKSNYDTDVWTPIFDAIQRRAGAAAYSGTLPDAQAAGSGPRMIDVSYRVIADHLRCLTFALTDGAVPSNEGRGYVLRRILRRAVRYGRQYLDLREPFLCDLVEPLVAHMADAFPELRAARGGRNVAHVVELLREEEESFGRTLDRGIKLFDEAADFAVNHHHGKISGGDAFKLHDTYGFPIDLTELMAVERGLTVNIGEYERLMDDARERARAVGGGETDFNMNIASAMPPTDDSPKYEGGPVQAELLGYVQDGVYIDDGEVPFGGRVALVLDRTCFYGEQGGQVGDRGNNEAAGEAPGAFDVPGFRVTDTKRFGDTILHIGEAVESEFPLKVGDQVRIEVEDADRAAIMKNHTATHLLNWALREVLGDGVQQKGSLVDAEKTRFDFSHNKPMTPEELARVEALVNEQIDAKQPVYIKEVDQAVARQVNTLRAVFGEKYPDTVRVVSVGADIDTMLADPRNARWMKHAVEFCGGTHLCGSADAERFVLLAEEGVAKGVRRVTGITGRAAGEAVARGERLSRKIAEFRDESPEALAAFMADAQKELNEVPMPVTVRHALREKLDELRKKLKTAEKRQSVESGGQVRTRVEELYETAETWSGVTVVVGEVPHADADALRGAIDWVRNKSQASAVFLAMADGDKVTLIAGMSKDAVAKGLKAGDLIRETAPVVGGKGGGRPDMAQGGGNDPSRIAESVQAARVWLKSKLG
jgi:alanyl-tRNA synthetase